MDRCSRAFYLCTIFLLAAALYTPRYVVAQEDSHLFPETGKLAGGAFLRYWQTHGGLAQQGYPITEEIREKSAVDGNYYTVQYFERAVFERHYENEPPNDVLLSLLGVFAYHNKYPGGAPNQQPSTVAGSVPFSQTGKRLGGSFLQYWQTHGQLAQNGFPISDEFMEKSDLDGKPYRVQYFERAVFEQHSENKPPNNILLSQLGTVRYRTDYGTDVAFRAEDGDTIQGSVFGSGSTTVVFSNQSDQSKHGWATLGVAQALAGHGYKTLAYEYHPAKKGHAPTPDKDLHAAVVYARAQGATRVVLMGGSLGGWASANGATSENPEAVVVMSAPTQIYGLTVSDSDLAASKSAKLFICSEDDAFCVTTLHLYDVASQPKEKVVYSGSVHGVDLFNTDHREELMQHILVFLSKYAPAQ